MNSRPQPAVDTAESASSLTASPQFSSCCVLRRFVIKSQHEDWRDNTKTLSFVGALRRGPCLRRPYPQGPHDFLSCVELENLVRPSSSKAGALHVQCQAPPHLNSIEQNCPDQRIFAYCSCRKDRSCALRRSRLTLVVRKPSEKQKITQKVITASGCPLIG